MDADLVDFVSKSDDLAVFDDGVFACNWANRGRFVLCNARICNVRCIYAVKEVVLYRKWCRLLLRKLPGLTGKATGTRRETHRDSTRKLPSL